MNVFKVMKEQGKDPLDDTEKKRFLPINILQSNSKASSIFKGNIQNKLEVPRIIVLDERKMTEDQKSSFSYISQFFKEKEFVFSSVEFLTVQSAEEEFMSKLIINPNCDNSMIVKTLASYISYILWIEETFKEDRLRAYFSIEYYLKTLIRHHSLLVNTGLRIKDILSKVVLYAEYSQDGIYFIEHLLEIGLCDDQLYLYLALVLFYEQEHDFRKADISLMKGMIKRDLKSRDEFRKMYKSYEQRMIERFNKLISLTAISDSTLNDVICKANDDLISTSKRLAFRSNGEGKPKITIVKNKTFNREDVHKLKGYIISLENQGYDSYDSILENQRVVTLIYEDLKAYVMCNDSNVKNYEDNKIFMTRQKKSALPFSFLSKERQHYYIEKQDQLVNNLTSNCIKEVIRLSITPKAEKFESKIPASTPLRLLGRSMTFKEKIEECNKISASDNAGVDYIIMNGVKYIKEVTEIPVSSSIFFKEPSDIPSSIKKENSANIISSQQLGLLKDIDLKRLEAKLLDIDRQYLIGNINTIEKEAFANSLEKDINKIQKDAKFNKQSPTAFLDAENKILKVNSNDSLLFKTFKEDFFSKEATGLKEYSFIDRLNDTLLYKENSTKVVRLNPFDQDCGPHIVNDSEIMPNRSFDEIFNEIAKSNSTINKSKVTVSNAFDCRPKEVKINDEMNNSLKISLFATNPAALNQKESINPREKESRNVFNLKKENESFSSIFSEDPAKLNQLFKDLSSKQESKPNIFAQKQTEPVSNENNPIFKNIFHKQGKLDICSDEVKLKNAFNANCRDNPPSGNLFSKK